MRHDWIQKCLDSLIASSIKTEIIVIDNGSADETVDFIQKNYPQVDVIEAKENLGFAKANNRGIRKAYDSGADYFFLLNQDARVETNTIEKLIEVFEQKPHAGIVSPIHLNGDKTKLDYGFSCCVAPRITPHFISDVYCNCLQNVYETKLVYAAAWLLNRNCIETVGGFDTLVFYHYGEDDNYCHRVLYHQFKLYIATTASICHDTITFKKEYTEEDKQLREYIRKCVYYADIQKDDAVIFEFKKSSIKSILKNLVHLRLNTLLTQRIEDKKFIKKQTQSRAINKTKGLHWL